MDNSLDVAVVAGAFSGAATVLLLKRNLFLHPRQPLHPVAVPEDVRMAA